MSRHH